MHKILKMEKEKEYKGIYIHDNNETIIYYEHGAHFRYKELYKRLEEIIKNKNYINKKNKSKAPYKKFFANLKKANSQKVIRYENNKILKINISRNTKVNPNLNSIYNNINNKSNLNKTKSINKFIDFSKSYNEEQFGSFSSGKKINLKKSKDIILKKNIKNNIKNEAIVNNNIITTNKKNLKNNHTVLKNFIMPKKSNNNININNNKNDNLINSNYYGISPNKFINIDSDINSYGELSYNSTYNNYNNKIQNEQIDLRNNNNKKEYNSQNKDENQISKRYKKIKISSIINKRFIQKLIKDSPKNNSSFLSNNNSAYYSKSKTQRTSENNNVNCSFNSYKKQKFSHMKIFNNKNKQLYNLKSINKNVIKNRINENNYYIENNNGNRLFFNNNINKNILLSNQIKQKNKKLTIYNIFNKINFQKTASKMNYLNNHKKELLLSEREKKYNSNKNLILKNQKINQKNNCNFDTKINKGFSFIKNNIKNNISNNNNSTLDSKNSTSKKKTLKNNYSQSNLLNINLNNNKNKNNNINSLAFCIDNNNITNIKKSRNNNSKNIVNLLCCHFSINFNSPINLLNNIQNNVITNNANNKTPKITNTNFSINNFKSIINNNNDIKKLEKKKLNINNSKSKNKENKISINNNIKLNKSKNNKEIENKKNYIKKIKKIPINITKDKNTKIKAFNISNMNYIKDNNKFIKKKFEKNIFKNRYNSSKRIITQKAFNNSGNTSSINNYSYSKKSLNVTKKINTYNTNSLNNISINSNANTTNISSNKNLIQPGGSFISNSRKSKI